jgi:hypothetical protein
MQQQAETRVIGIRWTIARYSTVAQRSWKHLLLEPPKRRKQ